MNCEQARFNIVERHEQVLSAQADAELTRHLEECAECRAEAEMLASLRARLARAAAESAADESTIPSLVMSRIAGRQPARAGVVARTLRWAVPLAAAAGLAIGLSAHFAAPRSASAAVLATMAAKVRQAGSVAFRMANVQNGVEINSANFILLNGRTGRAEFNDGRVVVTDLDQRTALVLMPAKMWATLSPVKSQDWNPFPILLDMANQPGEIVGEEEIDGDRARIVRTVVPKELGGTGDATLWISIATGLPLKVEFIQGVQMPGQPKGDATVVLSGFALNGEYDASLFSLSVPPGYTLRPPTADTMVATNQASINARNIAMALFMYRSDKDQWPDTLQTLVDAEFLKADYLENARLPGVLPGYLYFKPVTEPAFEDAILFEPLADWPGTTVVAFKDSHVEVIGDQAMYNRLLSAARERAGNR